MGQEGSGCNAGKKKKRQRYEAPGIWLWFAGRDLDEEGGKGRTDATWTRDATRVFYPYPGAPVSRWSKMAHWKRSAIRQAFLLGLPLTAWDYWHHPAVTILALSLLTAIYGGYYGWRGWHASRQFFPLKQYWEWGRPFRLTLQAELGIVPERLSIEAHPDTGDPVAATIVLPVEYLGSDHERAAVTKAVEQILAIEAPKAAWNLVGRSHMVRFSCLEPPPPHLWWDEIEHHILAAKYDEMVFGIGEGGDVIKASIKSDSPMFGIGMGSGAGKTNLAAFLLAQRLRLGDIGYMIDGKRFSHPYLFKDMEARRDQLANVGYVRRIDDIHRGLIRLGLELADRNERAENVINAKGQMLGFIGHRLWVVLEELNMVVPLLKEYWRLERDRLLALAKEGLCDKPPKQSPALLALTQLSFAGRQVGIHLIFIGQRLDADVLGTTAAQGSAVRGNINVRALARYDEQAWALQAGKGCPMPPPPSVDGRIQLWVGGQVSETQVPEMDYEQVRHLAVSGKVTPVPSDWPGVAHGERPALPPVPVLTPHTVIPPGQDPVVLGHVGRPDGMMTIREAIDEGRFNGASLEAIRQRVKRAKRKGKIRGGMYDGSSELFSEDEMKELVR